MDGGGNSEGSTEPVYLAIYPPLGFGMPRATSLWLAGKIKCLFISPSSLGLKERNGPARAGAQLRLLAGPALLKVRHFSGVNYELIPVCRKYAYGQPHRPARLVEGSPEYLEYSDPPVLRQVKEIRFGWEIGRAHV